MNEQMSLFDYSFEDAKPKELSDYKIKNKVRLIELFAGIGSQAMALKRLGVPFEHYRVVEFDKYAIASYNAIHGTEFPPTDITKISGSDLGIVDTYLLTYLLTYSFPCQDYKQAGNSIVVNVLVAILGQLFEGKEDVYKEISEKERPYED